MAFISNLSQSPGSRMSDRLPETLQIDNLSSLVRLRQFSVWHRISFSVASVYLSINLNILRRPTIEVPRRSALIVGKGSHWLQLVEVRGPKQTLMRPGPLAHSNYIRYRPFCLGLILKTFLAKHPTRRGRACCSGKGGD